MRINRITPKLVGAFAMLICIIVAVGCLGLNRLAEMNGKVQKIVDQRWRKVQLSREALRYSSLNSRLTMQIFLLQDRKEIEPLLLQRAAHTEKISALLTNIAAQVESEAEQALIADIWASRMPYVNSYKRALNLLLQEGRPEAGRQMMSREVLDNLNAYHRSWEAFVEHQGKEMDQAGDVAERRYYAARNEMITLITLATLLAMVIAFFVIRKMRREIGNRQQAEQNLREAHEALELRVRERNADLAKTNEALSASQALYHSLVEQLPAGVFRKDKNGCYVFANSAFCQTLGLTAEQIIGKTPPEVIACMPAIRKNPEAEKLGTQGVDHQREILETGRQIEVQDTYLGADGRPRYYHTVKSAVFGPEGAIVGTQGVLFDITERRRADDALRESQALYDSLVEHLPAGIFRKDYEGRYVFVNSRFCRLKDRRAEEILGRTPDELANYESTLTGARPAERIHQRSLADQGADHHELILRTGELVEREEIYLRPDGTTQYFQAIKSPVFAADQKIVGTQGILFDITGRKQAEQALQRTEELYRRAIGGAGAVPYSNDFKTKSYLFMGEGIKQLIGYEPHEVTSALWSRIIQKSVMLGEAAGLVKEEASRRVVSGELRHWRCDMCVTTRDGRTRWISDASVQDLDAQGRPIFSMGILQDITERKQAEAELAYERQLLRALMETSPDHIYFKDRESRFIRCSERQAQQFGLTGAEKAIGKCDEDFFNGEHAREAYQDEQNIIYTGQPLIGKIEKETWPDGKVTWVLTNKLPLRDQAGEIIGTFGLSKDITAIKEAEVKLAEIHQQLLETSRLAGMAEVATGVLHNVGNVLNSVNIASNCIAENIRKSKATNLPKLVALLREHEPDLGEFLTTDPRGSQVVGYLAQLADHIAKEHADALKELMDLQKHVDHIKEIVAMQQSFAKVSGLTETLNVSELVEDALHINEGALARHDIQVTREFEDVPLITVEKHKVLQILVNLVSNAKHACDAANRPDKRLTVRVTGGQDRVNVIVADNGVGIPPENLTRIFAHGFTTKKNGHGFGLHSGALAAREIGGALHVQSEGVGRGTAFTLELPLKPARCNHA